MYISWKNPVFFLLFIRLMVERPPVPAHGSFHGTGCELNSQNSHKTGSEGVSVLPATCLGSELCGICLLSNLETGRKARCVCQRCSKRHRICNSARNLRHIKKEKLLSVKSQKIMTSPASSCKIRERQPRVFIHQRCVFQDAHLEDAFTLWRTHGTQIWGNPSESCTASSAPANL